MNYKAYEIKIREIVENKSYWIRRHHIEEERKYREIQVKQVEYALFNGGIRRIRNKDKTIFWQGKDQDGRLLELQCSLVDDDVEDTLVLTDAYELRVGTAYPPGVDDDFLRNEWLKNNPDFELAKDGKKVRKKRNKK